MTNYRCGHETLMKAFGADRFAFEDQHIEIDNRLSWFLGTLDKCFGDEAIYVHLHRDKQKTATSFTKRFGFPRSIIDAFSEGIKIHRVSELSAEEKLQMAVDYVDTITDNIELFLRDKSRKMDFHIEQFETDFRTFWELIGAEGDYDLAVAEFSKIHNAHGDQKFATIRFNLNSFLFRLKRLFSK
ncbi:MAG: hypothetical protein R8G66_18660 [Cytophagales bacterium]|nr:hypothetical protein [Cytophagales bacterium]